MRVTKFEHSTLVVEEDGRRLVIDPGGFTRPLSEIVDVDGIVITHEHPDHWTPDQLTVLLTNNPDATIYAPAGAAAALAGAGFASSTVTDGDEAEAGPFALRFVGTRHAVIHESIPVIDNTGVFVGDALFHPGDSYTVPPFDVPLLAAPLGAPWLKIGEAMDYVAAVKPSRLIPIHERTLSEVGFAMHLDRLRTIALAPSGEAVALGPGESLEV